MKNKTTWRSFSVPYRLLVSTEDYQLTEELLDFLTTELNHQIKTNWTTFQNNTNLSRGEYWNKTNKLLASPSKKWPKETGQRAKYWRGLQEQIRQLAVSLSERTQTAQIAQKHNWTNSKKLREELTQNNLYPTNHQIQNICRAAALPTLPNNLEAVLDFTVQDKQTITQKRTLKRNLNQKQVDKTRNTKTRIPPRKRNKIR